jgi:methionyl-tRNA formyltransferase
VPGDGQRRPCPRDPGAAGWQEQHDATPGAVVHTFALSIAVACRDGFIVLLDWHLFGPQTVTGTPER